MNDPNSFSIYFDKFLAACDAQEIEDVWPVEVLGEMDAWLANDLSCIIIRLIFADGVIEPDEVRFLNSALGFNYTAEELRNVYETCGDRIDSFIEEALPEDISMLENIDPKLAEYFRRMLGALAQLVIKSDDDIAQKENDAAQKLLSIL